jgi:hypothetical protein
MTGMRVLKGRVVGSAIIVEEVLPEGTAVDVVVHGKEDEEFVLTEEMRAELREAAAAADRGELVDMDEVLAQVDW